MENGNLIHWSIINMSIMFLSFSSIRLFENNMHSKLYSFKLLCVLKTTQLQQSHTDYTKNKTQSTNLPPQVNKSKSPQTKTVFQNLITPRLRRF